jgi:hypothetical protein
MQAGEIPQFAPLHHDGTSRRASNEFSPPPPLDVLHPRKRTYSTISNEFSPAYQSQRPSGGWAPEPPRHLPHPASGYPNTPGAPDLPYRSQYSPNGLAPQPSWKGGPDTARRQSTSLEAAGPLDNAHVESKVEWDDTIIDG